MNGLWRSELQSMVIGKCDILSGFLVLELERGVTLLSDDPLFELE